MRLLQEDACFRAAVREGVAQAETAYAETFGTSLSSTFSVATRDELANAALARGVASIEGDFTRVPVAAKKNGFEQHFNLMIKLLSKYAHPTAMLILGNAENRKMPKDSTFANGCLFFIGAFTALENMSKGGV